ncbi:MAG: hypothetical protein WC370_07340 [Dehalococcoidales bacterium]
MLRIESLEIDDHILDKIESKHKITFEEIEQACQTETHHVRRSKEGLYKLFSQTNSGRYILVVLVNTSGSNWKIVTARDMIDSERRLFKAMGGK